MPESCVGRVSRCTSPYERKANGTNLEWKNWDILVPDSFVTTEAIGDEGVLVLGKRWFQGKDLD
jgi:hypothetical protein